MDHTEFRVLDRGVLSNGHRSQESPDQREQLDSGRGVLYQESRFLFVQDGSPITNVGDDREGMARPNTCRDTRGGFLDHP